MRSREATLRQSNRKQNSGYWRQISRPTSSRSRCFSFSPIVRTQGTISVCVAEAVLQVEAEVEATPINLPRLRPRRPGGYPHSRRPADRPPAAIAQSPAQGPAAPARPPPPHPLPRHSRPRGLPHDVPEIVTPWRPSASRSSSLQGRVARRPPKEGPISLATGLFWKSGGKVAAPSNLRLYRGGEREGCAGARGKLQPRAAAGPCLRDILSSRGPLGTVVFVTRAGGGMECVVPALASRWGPVELYVTPNRENGVLIWRGLGRGGRVSKPWNSGVKPTGPSPL